MTERIILSLCYKKSLLDFTVWKNLERMYSSVKPLRYPNAPYNHDTYKIAHQHLLDSNEIKLRQISQICFNNDNKDIKKLIQILRPNLNEDVTLHPFGLKASLINYIVKNENRPVLIFNFDTDVTEVYSISSNKLQIIAMSTDISLYESFNKMTGYLNPQENATELGINKALFYKAQILDENLINSFTPQSNNTFEENLDFRFVTFLQKYNDKIFKKEGFKKQSYEYKEALKVTHKLNLYERFSQEILNYINYKIENVLLSFPKEELSKYIYVMSGESFRNERLRTLLESIMLKKNVPQFNLINPFDYSTCLKHEFDIQSHYSQGYSIKNIDNLKIYDSVYVPIII